MKKFGIVRIGSAICAGYIKDVNQRISDWSLVKDTLYQDQNS